MRNCQIETIRETRKARLVKVGEVSFWIQKRWLRPDGTLTPAGVKALDKAVAEAEEKAKGEKWYRIEHLIERETEKAMAIKVHCDAFQIEKDMYPLAWFPKSMIKGGRVPGWLLGRKMAELEEEGREKYHGWMIMTEFDDFIYVK